MKHLFVGGHRKSGTTLLASLLDGHPDLWVYPYETHFWYSFYPEYLKSKYTLEQQKDRIKNFLLKDLCQIVLKWGKKEIFQKELENNFDALLSIHNKDVCGFFVSMIDAVRNVLDKEIRIKDKIVITKDTHSEIYVNEIFKIYPDAKFINIVRDPRDNFASILTGWDKHYKNQYDSKERLLRDFIDRGYLCMNMAKDNWLKFGITKYKNICYEKLVQSPKKSMTELCQWIGIRESLLNLNPTCCGVEWKGNSFTKIYKGINKNRIGIYKEILTEYQRKVIEYYFGDIMEYFGYTLDYKKEECVDAVREHYKWLNANGFHSGKPYRKY